METTMITVADLHAALAQLIDNGMGENELRLAIQPSWPLTELVEGLWYNDEAQTESEDGPVEPPPVFIVSGGSDHSDPYAPREAFENPILDF